ncbi:hypothetical protein WJX72_005873 [[Myrmecia] bisecta]|uniref:Protein DETOXIFICATION n=1 Tax=[Myrmecia] bisecta TaxID=41462 RepID=A0AAW1QF97_9CHLO
MGAAQSHDTLGSDTREREKVRERERSSREALADDAALASISTAMPRSSSLQRLAGMATPPRSRNSSPVPRQRRGEEHAPLLQVHVSSDGTVPTAHPAAFIPPFAKRRKGQQLSTNSALWRQNSKPEFPRSPWAELRDITSLALPVLGYVLADPLMALVDTACVGRMSSLELASLGPNMAVFTLIFQVFAFLSVSTTNIIATHSLHAPGISDVERRRRLALSQRILSYALVTALGCAVSMVAVLQLFAPTILGLVGTSAEMMAPALRYMRIRAFACPAVMLMSVAQGACLGQQDAWTPFRMFLTAGFINLCGDYLLIVQLGYGIAGAAMATTGAQYIAATYFLWHLRRQGQREKGIPITWQGLPSFAAFRPFMGVAIILLTRTAFTMLAYTGVTTAATLLGTVSAASHSVALQVFWFLSFFPEPMSMTAQSLIARDSTDPIRVRRMAYLLLRIGTAIGMTMAGVISLIFHKLPWLFTSDEAVMQGIRPLANQASAAIMLCALTMICDGVSIGSSDFSHLPRINFISMVTASTMLIVGHRQGYALGYVWWGLVTLFGTRLAQHALHIFLHWDRSAFGGYHRSQPPISV